MYYKPLVPLLLLALTPQAGAQETADAWQFGSEIAAGYRYDSNVGLSQVDENTSQNDQAMTLRGKLKANWQATDRLAFATSYQFEQENYREFSQYDLQIQTLMGEVSYQLPWFKAGISQHNAAAEVANQKFLDFEQTSYFLGDLIGDNFYWRLAHQRLTKTLPDYPKRDAEAAHYSADTFWFFQQGSGFLTLGYTNEDEDAADAKFSFSGHKLRSSIHRNLQAWGQQQKLSLSIDYQDRDYQAAWLPGTAARRDQITSVKVNGR